MELDRLVCGTARRRVLETLVCPICFLLPVPHPDSMFAPVYCRNDDDAERAHDAGGKDTEEGAEMIAAEKPVCDHVFCRDCLRKHLTEAENRAVNSEEEETPLPGCPMCRAPCCYVTTTEFLLPSNDAILRITALLEGSGREGPVRIRCSDVLLGSLGVQEFREQGCGRMVRALDWQDHLQECKKVALYACPYCQRTTDRYSCVQHHVSSVFCMHCGGVHPACPEAAHMDDETEEDDVDRMRFALGEEGNDLRDDDRIAAERHALEMYQRARAEAEADAGAEAGTEAGGETAEREEPASPPPVARRRRGRAIRSTGAAQGRGQESTDEDAEDEDYEPGETSDDDEEDAHMEWMVREILYRANRQRAQRDQRPARPEGETRQLVSYMDVDVETGADAETSMSVDMGDGRRGRVYSIDGITYFVDRSAAE